MTVTHHAPSDRAGLFSSFETSAVGVSFQPTYPDNLLVIARITNDGGVVHYALAPDPTNAVDPLAVHVVCTDTGEVLGHLPKALGNRLSPLLDTEEWDVVDGWVTVSGRDPSKPGLRLKVRRVERDAAQFTAALEGLLERMRALDEHWRHILFRRWAASRLGPVPTDSLRPGQLAYARALVSGVEAEALRRGATRPVDGIRADG